MLDEPTLGLAPKLAMEMLGSLKSLNEQGLTGLTILLVSQEVLQCLRLAQKGYVLENGRVALEGICENLLKDEAIRRSYLGL